MSALSRLVAWQSRASVERQASMLLRTRSTPAGVCFAAGGPDLAEGHRGDPVGVLRGLRAGPARSAHLVSTKTLSAAVRGDLRRRGGGRRRGVAGPTYAPADA